MPDTEKNSMLGERVSILQSTKGYRTGIDPIFLAAAVPAFAGQTILEIGSGTGAASLCLRARVPDIEITGIELEKTFVELASESVRLNSYSKAIKFLQGDILCPPNDLVCSVFDHVMANPPYFRKVEGIPSRNTQKAKANFEGAAALLDWVEFALRMVCDGGSITFIHRYDRIDELVSLLKTGVGNIRVVPLWPKVRGKGAKRAIVQGRKGVIGEKSVAGGVILHDKIGGYTLEALEILRDAGRLKV